MEYSDEELEPFQMTGDEFRPRRRKFTKEDRIYGLWAKHDSDDESSSRKSKDYTQPVNFVRSAQQDENGTGDDDSDYDDQDLDEEARQILEGLEQEKLEQGGKKAAVGNFTHASLEKNKKLSMLPSNKKMDKDDGQTKAVSSSKPISLRKQMKALKSQPSDKEFGKWEKYSSGFGSKMLSKMGWKHGKGLGSYGEGIVNPVKAVGHKEFGKGLAHMQIKKSLVDVSDSDGEREEGEEEEPEEEQQWRRGKASSKPKYRYKTVDELKETSLQHHHTHSGNSGSSGVGGIGGVASVKVIDMTGPQKRVLSSYEEIHNRHARPDEASQTSMKRKLFLPELLHNVQMLVDNTEQDIIRTDRQLHYNRDLVVNLRYEVEQREGQKEDEDKQIEKLSQIFSTINLFEERMRSPEQPHLTLTECEEMMRDLQDKYPVEYKAYGLSSVAVAIMFPLIKTSLNGWDMLGTPCCHLEEFRRWKNLLREQESDHTMPSSDSMDPYDRLVWEVWLPKLRTLMLSWSSRVCDPMVQLLEYWCPLLPSWIMENILDQLVLPKLQVEQEAWDPTTDIMPIHKWIHPWLPLMEKKMEILYPSIRYKMASALNNWHPSDKSAHKILEPWVQVFTSQVMESFVVRTILPKLSYCLQVELQINPHQQKIAPFEWVMAWKDMVGPHHYASMLEKNFFPKWLQVLSSWLGNIPNFDEVTKWYTGWKGMLDPVLLREPSIKFYLNQALDMMNRAVAGNFQPGTRENMAYFVSTEKRRQSASLQNAISAPASVSFKDIIEQAAESHGILFMPAPGQKRHEGKLLYNFGSTTLYIDRGVTFVLRPNSQWHPVSVDELLRLA